jgi:hypothetical protein
MNRARAIRMKTSKHDSTVNHSFNSLTHTSILRRIGRALTLMAALPCFLMLPASAKTLVAGPPLVQIAAGNSQVWGLDGAGNLYQYSGGTFNLIGATYSQVAVGEGTDVWALGTNGHPYQWNSTTKTLNEISSSLEFTQIATGSGGTWAITSGGDIYSYNVPLKKFEKFTKGPPPKAENIFVGGAPEAVWILDDLANQPHLYNTKSGLFNLVPGVGLFQVAVGHTTVWGLDLSGQVRLYHPTKPFEFNVVAGPPTGAALLTVTTNSEFWAISLADHAVYHYNTATKLFDLVDDSETYEQISAGNSTIGVWALTNKHKIYKF